MRSMKPKRPFSSNHRGDAGDLLARIAKVRASPRAPAERGATPVLTRRQREVVALLVGTGLSYKEIAAELGLGVGTVRTHTEKIYRAFDVHSRPELTVAVGGHENVPFFGDVRVTEIAVPEARQGC